ncbi:MAG: RdgB/HAM1 family non-canonical purine NTP pyrophosphatase [Bryobacteraceae bacterium]
MLLYAATKNEGKLREFVKAAARSPVKDLHIQPLPGLSEIEPPVESGSTFAENAAIKAQYYSRFINGFVFADDSGLEVDALQGAPGVYSARYAGEDATDAENNALLLENLLGVKNRAARFVCVIALARHGRVLFTTQGSVEGEILTAERGLQGFGYDPLFFFPPFSRTFAEISQQDKFQVSHRGLAFRALLDRIAACALDGS